MARLPRILIFAYSLFLLGMVFAYLGCEKQPGMAGGDGPGNAAETLTNERVASNRCRDCHQEIFEKWERSHHALANRPVELEEDREAFSVSGEIGHGESAATVRVNSAGDPLMTFVEGSEAAPGGQPLFPDMAIGVDPLIQYLIPFGDGRWQTTELAWDPMRKEWFNVYGQQERRPEEWGSWHGRGMNWNSMCAECHMTDYHKNYQEATDSYDSTWIEQGVGCMQCHGNVQNCPEDVHDFAINQTDLPIQPELVVESCATCHSRRSNLTGNFKPGERYNDHYRLQLPVVDGLYYADGQIRDEVYVYTSYKMSAMGHAGVRCMDCHDPHSNELILPWENNALCMRCHGGAEVLGATTINPTEHSFHKAGSTGNLCVECHMTHTTYMERDPRRDHGWIKPDPVLTKELGIPNACNKCHDDQTVDWAIEWSEKWYGEKLAENRERERTRAVARAYAGDVSALPDLLAAMERETQPLWKASLLTLAGSLAPGAPEVLEVARPLAEDPVLQIRKAALSALAQSPAPQDQQLSRQGLEDRFLDVRLQIGWIQLESLSPGDKVFQELLDSLKFNSDQPTGAAVRAEFYSRRGQFELAERWLKKALEWDDQSPPLYQALALALNAQGKSSEALAQLHKGQRLAPDSPDIPFMIALLQGELGNIDATEKALRQTVEIDPGYSRAWYNLGLLQSQRGEEDAAMESLRMAIETNPTDPAGPYALATIHARRGEAETARELLRQTLRLAPEHTPARQLLNRLMITP